MAGNQSPYMFCRAPAVTRRFAARLVFLWAGSLACAFADDGWQHGLSNFGTFKYTPGFSHFDYVNPDAPKGGRLVLAYGAAFNNFTPYITKGIGAPGSSVIGQMTLYDSLLWPSGDEVGVFYGNLAKEIRVADDMMEVRLRLHPEARWHDGLPVTARDIKFSFEHIRDNSFPGLKTAFASIKQVDVVSEREVRISYKYPVNLNTMMSLGKVAMMPEHYWRDRDSGKTTIEPPLSSGPYQVGDFQLGKYIEFKRVENYWGRNLGIHRGRHNIDVLRHEVYRDATVQREALRKGLIDYSVEPSAAQWMTGYKLDGKRSGLLVREEQYYRHAIGVVSALAYNLTQPRFQDVRVREALTLAFDFDWMNETIDFGVYQKPGSFFHGTFLAASGLPGEAELELLTPFAAELPTRVFTHSPFSGSPVSRLGQRDALLRARGLLQEAGWRVQDGRLVDATGTPFEIEFLTNVAAEKRIFLPYVQQLRRLGIEASIRLVETAQFFNLRRNNKNDAVLGSLAIAMPPSLEVPAYFGSTSSGIGNFARISSPVVDYLSTKVLSAGTEREMAAATRALDRVLYWQFYFIPVRVVEPIRALVWRKFTKPANAPFYVSGYPDTWWWDREKAEIISRLFGSE